MKLMNKNSNGFSHTAMKKVKIDGEEVLKPYTYTLNAGGVADVPKEIADIWLKIPGVEKYVAPEDLKKVEEDAKKELEALKKEVEKAKAAETEALKQVEELTAELEALKKRN